MGFNLTPEQQTAVDNTGGCLLVSAAAGSGKTKVLVDRVMRLVMEGYNVDQLLIITFTKAAAAELRGRILEVLKQKQLESPEDVHLQKQSALIYRAQISTIHSFCQVVLKEDGHRIDLDPDSRVADDNAIRIIQTQVLDRILEQHYQNIKEGDRFSHLLDTMSSGRDDKKLVEMVLKIFEKVQSHPDPRDWLQQQCRLFALDGITSVDQTPWGQVMLRDSLEQARHWQGRMEALLTEVELNGTLPTHQRVLDRLVRDLNDFVTGLENGWDDACAAAKIDYGRFSAPKKDGDKALAARATQLKSACKNRMDKVTARFSRDDSGTLEDLHLAGPAVISLLELVQEFDEAFTREKRRRKLVDYGDLEHLALKLLKGEGEGPSPVALRYQYTFAEVMVDEYQDTNQVQNQLFRLITDGGRKLFMVGDVKQSIYRFRLADPSIFLNNLNTFSYYDRAEEGEPRKVILSKNFRSRKSVLNATNFIFRCLMSRDFGEMDYTRDHRLNWGLPYPDYDQDCPELDLVDVSQLHLDEEQARPTKNQIEADFVARRLRELMDQGYQVTEGSGFRPLEWTDIVILLRSPGRTTGDFTKALDAHRIPWQTDGKSDFFSATEIQVAISYLQIIDNPHQDIPLISVLRSPLYGFTPDQLANLRVRTPEGDFYTAVLAGAKAGDSACQDFVRQLSDLRFYAADRTASGLVWEMYEQTAMLPIYTALPGGELRRSNLILLYEHARQFEQNGYRGLFDFLTQLRRMIENGQEIQVTGTQGSGVRIMSIHKSKGLEFPVVVLAGLFHKFNIQDESAPMLFHAGLGVGPNGMDLEQKVQYPTLARLAVRLKLHQEMCAEELRLLYVAMTRAREKLIMVGTIGEFPGKDSASSAKKSKGPLEKYAEEACFPMDPQTLAGMSRMGDWIVSAAMTRPEGSCLWQEGQPQSMYVPDEEDTPWDIRLVPGQLPTDSVRKTEMNQTSTTQKRQKATFGLSWKYPYGAISEIPSKLTATQLKGRYQDQEAAQDSAPEKRPVTFRVPSFTREAQPLTAAERGTALHLFVQLCNPEKTLSYAGAKAELSRLTENGCISREQAQVIPAGKVTRFFRSPLGTLAREMGMEREFKFSLLTDAAEYFDIHQTEDQVLLQGVVDLWFRTIEGIVVVDFKTDYVLPGEEGEKAQVYLPQMDVYSAALEKITGLPVAHRYLWFFATDTPCEV